MASTSSSLYSIECSDQPLDFSFHPQKETLVAAALVDGTLEVHDFQTLVSTASDNKGQLKDDDDDDDDDEDDTLLSSTHIHTQLIPNTSNIQMENNQPAYKKASCRAVLFSHNDPDRLYTGGSAGDLCAIHAEGVCTFSTAKENSVAWRIESASVGKATKINPIHVLHQMPTSCCKGPLIVSGDDQGGVRLWDERLCSISNNNNLQQQPQPQQKGPLQLPQGCVLSWKENKDYISALEHSDDGNTLLATSADGTLTMFDIRQASTSNILQNTPQNGILRQSDPQDDELLSLAIIKGGKKVVCGTQEGVLDVWSWGTWGDISDRYPNGHANKSIDALLKVDEDTLLTGCSDGLVRVVSLHPNKVLGVLGDHGGFPIESLAFNANRKFVGSLSHDNYIRLWDASILHENDNDADEKMDEEDDTTDVKTVAATNRRKLQPVPLVAAATARSGQASDDEWEDMDEDDEEEEMDDKDSDDDDKDSDDKDKDDSDSDSDSDDGKPSRNDSRASRFKSKSEEFFADL